MTVTNGRSTPKLAFPGGIHVPSLTFFKNGDRQDIDWDIQEKHFEFLISSGLHGSRFFFFSFLFSEWTFD
jgi:hypothetical protein